MNLRDCAGLSRFGGFFLRFSLPVAILRGLVKIEPGKPPVAVDKTKVN